MTILINKTCNIYILISIVIFYLIQSLILLLYVYIIQSTKCINSHTFFTTIENSYSFLPSLSSHFNFLKFILTFLCTLFHWTSHFILLYSFYIKIFRNFASRSSLFHRNLYYITALKSCQFLKCERESIF